jgi:hypothetical protein
VRVKSCSVMSNDTSSTLMRTTQVADWQAEQEVFGADHTHVGAYCLRSAGNAQAETEARMGHGT